MARTSGGCACRVPLSEVSMQAFRGREEQMAFLRERGIDVGPDYRGRLSVPVAAAQRLYEERAAAATKEVAAAQREQEIANAAHNARLEMVRAYNEVKTESRGVSEAGQAAADAILAALPPEVRRRVRPLRLDSFGASVS
jgi:hypothetical protein